MELILWRHAEAEISEPDAGRALTAKGREQASKMAGWLDRKLPDSCRILVSPALRCVQTAEALGRKFKLHPELAVGATPGKLLAAANWPNSCEPVLLIGHQPTLGQAAALLIVGRAHDWSLRKAGIFWISQHNDGSTYLRAVLGPDLIGK